MELEQKLYQMFILGLEGGGIEDALKKGLGGIIFFSKDIFSQVQFKQLITKFNSISKIPPFMSIDQEGGRVERTENIHHGKKYLSARYAFEKGNDFLRNQTEEIAKELKSFGINLNFAPCIDVNTNSQNPIIGERAFSNVVEDVIIAEKIVSQTYRRNGIIPCAKHFPGHGDANADSHLTLPIINLPLEKMKDIHIKPFVSAIDGGIEMIMVAHLHCTCFDSNEIPASLSKNVLGYLRNTLHFKGVVVSDDMMMKGVEKFGLVEAFEMGIRFGIDMFIYRQSGPEVIQAIQTLAQKASFDDDFSRKIHEAYERIILLKKTKGVIS